MNKQGLLAIFNPKVVAYTLGGAIIGYFIFSNLPSIIIGAIAGFLLSSVR